MDGTFELFVAAFGAVAVGLFARKYFDTPTYQFRDAQAFEDLVFPPRHLTSRIRYRSALFLYFLLMELLYVLLAFLFPAIGDKLVPLPPPPKEVEAVSAFLISALILTAFLPNVGPVAAVEGRLRSSLHRIGRIPVAARKLHERLEQADVDPDPECSTSSEDPAFDAADLSSLDPVERRWARALCLRRAVDSWSKHASVGAYVSGSQSGWPLIQESFAAVEPMIGIYRSRFAERGASFDRQLLSSLDRLLYRLQWFLSCALFANEPTESQRVSRMRWMGFRLGRVEVIGWDQIALVLIGLAGWIFLVTSLMAFALHLLGWAQHVSGTMVALDSRAGSLIWSSTALALHGSAVLTVLLAKRWLRGKGHWPIPTAPLQADERRWLVYLAMAMAALVVGAAVLTPVGLGSEAGLQLWWAILSMPTAFLLAYYVDTHPTVARRVTQTLVQAGLTALVTWICSMHVFEIEGWYPKDRSNGMLVGFLVAQGALTGGFIGFWVPARYRDYVFRLADAPADPPATDLTLAHGHSG